MYGAILEQEACSPEQIGAEGGNLLGFKRMQSLRSGMVVAVMQTATDDGHLWMHARQKLWCGGCSAAVMPNFEQGAGQIFFAEHGLFDGCLGVAFQMTNILRDVKEDAAMGRIYLPTDDLASFGVTPQQLAVGAPMDKIRPLLKYEAARARELYKAGDLLLPMVEDESQPALWALSEIYRGILDCIEKRDYDVYTERARVTTAAKLGVLARGLLKRLA